MLVCSLHKLYKLQYMTTVQYWLSCRAFSEAVKLNSDIFSYGLYIWEDSSRWDWGASESWTYLDISYVSCMWECKCQTTWKLPGIHPVSFLVQSLGNGRMWSLLCHVMPPTCSTQAPLLLQKAFLPIWEHVWLRTNPVLESPGLHMWKLIYRPLIYPPRWFNF